MKVRDMRYLRWGGLRFEAEIVEAEVVVGRKRERSERKRGDTFDGGLQ